MRYPPSQSGIDSSAEDTTQFDVFELYGQNPVDMESGTDGGDESGICTRRQGLEETRIPAIPVEADGLHQLSGRSRALLKRYFEEADAVRLPVGHPRVLTDYTLRMSHSTMERMEEPPLSLLRRQTIFGLEAGLRLLHEDMKRTQVCVRQTVTQMLKLVSTVLMGCVSSFWAQTTALPKCP